MTETTLAPIVAILALGAVTFLLRSGGYWLMGRFKPSRRIERALEALPGAIVVATVAPIAVRGGVPAVACIAIAIGVMILTKRDFIAVVLAVAAAALLRAL